MAEGSDQGAAVTVNGNRSWSSWYNQPTGQFYHLAADNRFPYWVYSGQQDSGTVAIASRSDYGAPNLRDLHPVGGDERDYDIPDPADPNIVYGSGLGGRVSRWDARTGQVTDVSPWPVQNYGLRPTTVAHHFNWVTPLVASRSGPAALYLGGDVIFKSSDRGSSWSVISPDLVGKRAGAQNCDGDVTLEAALPCGYGTITAIEPSPLSAAGEPHGTVNSHAPAFARRRPPDTSRLPQISAVLQVGAGSSPPPVTANERARSTAPFASRNPAPCVRRS